MTRAALGRVRDRARPGLAWPDVQAATKYDGSPVLKCGCFMAGVAMPLGEPDTLVVRVDLDARPWLLDEAADTYYVTPYYEPHPVVLVRLARIDARPCATCWRRRGGPRSRRPRNSPTRADRRASCYIFRRVTRDARPSTPQPSLASDAEAARRYFGSFAGDYQQAFVGGGRDPLHAIATASSGAQTFVLRTGSSAACSRISACAAPRPGDRLGHRRGVLRSRAPRRGERDRPRHRGGDGGDARAAAAARGLQDRVTFRVADVLTAPIPAADVALIVGVSSALRGSPGAAGAGAAAGRRGVMHRRHARPAAPHDPLRAGALQAVPSRTTDRRRRGAAMPGRLRRARTAPGPLVLGALLTRRRRGRRRAPRDRSQIVAPVGRPRPGHRRRRCRWTSKSGSTRGAGSTASRQHRVPDTTRGAAPHLRPAEPRPATCCRRRDGSLEIFAAHDCRVTFFVLGEIAQWYPDLVREIAAHGHEIASHGMTHVDIPVLGPERFSRELGESLDLLARLTGTRPIGYRAPQPRLPGLGDRDPRSGTAIVYDSVRVRVADRSRRQVTGWANAPLTPYHPSYDDVATRGEARIVEVPLPSFPIVNVAAGSSIFTRVIGYRWTNIALRTRVRTGDTGYYVHPWEFARPAADRRALAAQPDLPAPHGAVDGSDAGPHPAQPSPAGSPRSAASPRATPRWPRPRPARSPDSRCRESRRRHHPPRLLHVPPLVRHDQPPAIEHAVGDDAEERRRHHDAGQIARRDRVEPARSGRAADRRSGRRSRRRWRWPPAAPCPAP